MMNLEQFLLNKLAEENVEVAQMALKIAQFGLTEIMPGQPYTNAERLAQEMDDEQGILEMLDAIGFEYRPNFRAIDGKKVKVIKYLKYSISLGKVEPNALQEYLNAAESAGNPVPT